MSMTSFKAVIMRSVEMNSSFAIDSRIFKSSQEHNALWLDYNIVSSAYQQKYCYISTPAALATTNTTPSPLRAKMPRSDRSRTQYDDKNADHVAIKKVYDVYTYLDSRSTEYLERIIRAWTSRNQGARDKLLQKGSITDWVKGKLQRGAYGSEIDVEGEDE